MSIKTVILSLMAAAALAGCAAPQGGGIPFPEGYAVMPGDRERWAQMSEVEQRRALAFLSTGASLQSSMEPDI